MLKKELEMLELQIKEKTNLRMLPSASATEMKKLNFIFGNKIPDAIKTWYGWHNGQSGEIEEGLGPEDNFRMLSIAEAVRAFKTYQKFVAKSGDRLGFPVLQDEALEYLVFDLKDQSLYEWAEGKKAGKRVLKSLEDWVKIQNKVYGKMKAPRKGLPAITPKSKWEEVKKVSPRSLADDPVGTLYWRRDLEKSETMAGKLDYCETYYFKAYPGRWLKMDGESPVQAKKELNKYFKKGIPSNQNGPGIFDSDEMASYNCSAFLLLGLLTRSFSL